MAEMHGLRCFRRQCILVCHVPSDKHASKGEMVVQITIFVLPHRAVRNLTLAATFTREPALCRSTSVSELGPNQSATLHISLPVPDFIGAPSHSLSLLCMYWLPCRRAVARSLTSIPLTPHAVLSSKRYAFPDLCLLYACTRHAALHRTHLPFRLASMIPHGFI